MDEEGVRTFFTREEEFFFEVSVHVLSQNTVVVFTSPQISLSQYETIPVTLKS